jgi:hypothetical protein
MAVGLFVLLVIAGIIHIFLGHFADGGLLLGLAGTLGGALYLLSKEQEKALDFLHWVQSNRQMIQQGWSYYNDKKITPRTVVTQYQACISFLVATTRFRSPRVVVGSDKSQGTAIIYTLISALFGWWGFPWGFIYTPQAIFRNLSGGYRESIAELLPKVDAEVERLEKKLRRGSSAEGQAAFSASAK